MTAEKLADYLHEELCTRNKPCGYDKDGRHREFYRDRGQALMEKLAPEIGSANVLLAAKAVIEELW